ncbi:MULTISPECIES: L-serine ammonia-lyase, iron-sulfur-dependent, subunit alpha [unclassified Paenibacillus]|uniref:L-cysteine desulfidase family protein n=1 Tax=unclassified Paenibacillus TaxID=185978 RepID=UPI0024054C00|nr:MULTISPECIES: L-serine ammonia-lyase, iron-sulfur-dependent, subunit alpha [unclassified Paenibacillus]MDF9840987.1 L-cysteine desulfidase [Paenibacillus sp. PastF-2]MDF9847841.1 L-cysteine desulfidase [Paenibacillus sp. PastM-2]MDF9854409.1 L-cysteine desulfidase [Paenibacillus sp. PastF-1]MDH6479420.1 L-cysteine desulfidase [Paenibacillus sp. PastH-2]MDH6505086.1 L-cysteine desulfidase [Paenibacillus sp. PastM-3]
MVNLLEVLKKEIVPAEGCTEPIAVAYAVSLAAELLEEEITGIQLFLSGNIIKNAMGVGIPGTGQTGLPIAAALGAVIHRSHRKLEILSGLTADELSQANAIIDRKVLSVELKDTTEKLYIEARVQSANHRATAVVAKEHTNIVLLEKDGIPIDIQKDKGDCGEDEQLSHEGYAVSLEGIYEFVCDTAFADLEFLLEGARMNKAISDEGLRGDYGLQVGKKMSQRSAVNLFGNDVANSVIAATAAASDARMDGSAMPVMTTAGSGNQGIAATLPVIKLAELMGKSDELLARAIALSNLVTVHVKHYIGRLSPLCGSGIAGGVGANSGIIYLMGGSLDQIKHGIQNTIASLSGMICDGAKSTCALKISTATNAAIQAATLAMNNISPTDNDGVIFEKVEDTIRNMERLVQEGLAATDETILNIMLSKA